MLHVCLQDEKLRIEALGGCVIWFGTWRVNGSLSVSRAIGKLSIPHVVYIHTLDCDIQYMHKNDSFGAQSNNYKAKG